MTGYAFLPDFGKPPYVQDHSQLMEKRAAEWADIQAAIGSSPYVPPVVTGWDASPRGANGVKLDDVEGMYPFTPVVEGSSPELLSEMIDRQRTFVMQNVPEGERYTPITAWNEVTEGASLLPRVVDSQGGMDMSYLDVIRCSKKEVCRV